MVDHGDILKIEQRGAVRVLTLNRPDKLNALNAALLSGLLNAVKEADFDEQVGALVLTGSGRAFSAGADLKETSGLTTEAEISAHADRLLGLFKATIGFSKPVLAAVDGFALGGGCGLAMCCDLIVAAQGSSFGFPEIKRGVMPALVTPVLVRRIGPTTALQLIWDGEHFSADEFAAMDRNVSVTAAGEALSHAMIKAEDLAAKDQHVVREIKALVRASEMPFEAALDAARALNIRERLAKQKQP